MATLREVERSAGRRFRDVGLAEIADDEPLPARVLTGYQRDGRAWVAVGDDDRVVAYLITDPVDGNVHIEQVSVHPACPGPPGCRPVLDRVDGRPGRRGRRAGPDLDDVS